MKNINKSPIFQKILKRSSQSLEDYAKQCYQYFNKARVYDESFLQAFSQELQECGYEKEYQAILKQFQKNPVLQTAHHLTPTNGPTFSAIDLLCLCGLQEEYYLVGAFSGVSFSNTAFSGSLCYQDLPLVELVQKNSLAYQILQKENANRVLDTSQEKAIQKIRLVTSSYKDDLIYNSDFQKYRLDFWDSFTPKTLKFFPKPLKTESVLNWNLQVCASLQKVVFQKKKIVYFDICRLVKNYLLLKLAEKNNPLLQILPILAQKSPDIALFYSRKKGKKSWKVQPRNLQDLEGSKKLAQGDCTTLLELLKKNYCPSLFLVFLTIAFFLGVRVLGSFQQIVYLPQYEKLLKKILPSFLYNGELFLEHEWEKTFTSGRLTTKSGLFYPLDYAFSNRYLTIKEFQNQPMSQLWKYF